MLKPSVWQTDGTTVVYMVPAEYSESCGIIMYQLTEVVERDLQWERETIELVGVIADTVRGGIEGLLFLGELSDVDSRDVTVLILWGDVPAEASGLKDVLDEELGIGHVVLPETGAIVPVLRFPPVENGWWLDAGNVSSAAYAYREMVEGGRKTLDKGDAETFVTRDYVWN